MVPSGMRLYMKSIEGFGLITVAEEVELAHRIQAGDEDARQLLIRSNLRLVIKIAFDFRLSGLPIEDLVAEGNQGLISAVDRYNPAKGAKFSTYAAWWIKQKIRLALSEGLAVIRIPTSSRRKMLKTKHISSRLDFELGRRPSILELARATAHTESLTVKLLERDFEIVSMQTPVLQGQPEELGNLLPDANTRTASDIYGNSDAIKHMIECLPLLQSRSQMILNMRFGLDGNGRKTLQQVSEVLGLTRERVRQLHLKAELDLRKIMELN